MDKMKIESGREYRSMVLDALDDEKVVEGYATTFDEPYELYAYHDEFGNEKSVREVVDKESFEGTDMSDVIMQYDHEGRVYARLSNGTLELEVDEHGLKVRANLGGTELGRNLYEEIRGGYTNKMSFGFSVGDAHMEADERGYLRTIKRFKKLYDVSAVSLPANDFTELSARKQCDGVIAELEAERLRAEEERHAVECRKESLAKRLESLKKGD